MKAWKAEISLALVTLIWGGTFTATQIGLDSAPPFLYITFRFTIALVFLLPIVAYDSLKKTGKILSIDKTTAIQGFVLGLFFAGGFLLQTLGLNMIKASKSAFITGMTVAITPFVFMIVTGKRPKIWSSIGVVVATVGLWIFTKPSYSNFEVGDVLTLLSCVFWAFYITYMDIFTKNKNSLSSTLRYVFMQFVAAAPVGFFAFLIFESNDFVPVINRELIYSLAFNAFLASILVTFIHTGAQKYTTPVKAALIFSLEPVFAAVIAFAVLGEFFEINEFVGGGILLSGIALAELGDYVFGRAGGRRRRSAEV